MSSYPEFLTKEDVAKGHQDYVKRFAINVWQSTELVSSSWSTEKGLWTCKLTRAGEDVTLTSVHLIFACGSAERSPVMPLLSNREQFRGTVLHSSDYHNSTAWKGRRGIVVGSANTGHDVADDKLNAGLASVTMIQRSRTYVLPVEYYLMVVKASHIANIPTEKADCDNLSLPVSIRRQIAMNYLHNMARNDSERFDALERAGFNVERYGDMASVLFERLGGHYMDVSTSAKISKGLIKVKSGSPPNSYMPDGLLLEDGTEVKADVIVFTTGFEQNMRSIAGRIVGPEVENQLEDFWGVNEEGELKGAFKYTGHPGVWYTGGDIAFARYYNRFIALQIKSQLMGAPLEVHKESMNE
ncbi:putative flavin-containing monooxygenase [Leptodontidium sp. MPI-SDFR-AT-0119]|nr:putative flavin-containing monooxygenase [Leptodontidium sp. MPI-SDFR-AT-0119]